jgi:hypothetical protein
MHGKVSSVVELLVRLGVIRTLDMIQYEMREGLKGYIHDSTRGTSNDT